VAEGRTARAAAVARLPANGWSKTGVSSSGMTLLQPGLAASDGHASCKAG